MTLIKLPRSLWATVTPRGRTVFTTRQEARQMRDLLVRAGDPVVIERIGVQSPIVDTKA